MQATSTDTAAVVLGPWTARPCVESRRPESRYVTTGPLGEGGTARVTAVLDPVLGREAALKRMHRRHLTDPITVRRFLQEARVTAHMDHPGVTRVLDLGLDASDCPWFTMELVRGETLAAWVRRMRLRRLAPEVLRAAVGWLAQVADAVHHAHGKGIVHRDLKPENVICDPAGHAYVLDWGAAHLLSPAAALAWAPAEPQGSIVGTPCYFAPEQARGQVDRIDARTDVFGLGGLLFYLLTGRPPHPPGPLLWVARQVACLPVADPRAHVPVGLPHALCRIARAALCPEPQGRPWSAAGLAAQLRAWVADTGDAPALRFGAATRPSAGCTSPPCTPWPTRTERRCSPRPTSSCPTSS